MSAIEKALRHIGEQRGEPRDFVGLSEPLKDAPHAERERGGPGWLALVLAIVCTALVTGIWASHWRPFAQEARPTQPEAQATTRPSTAGSVTAPPPAVERFVADDTLTAFAAQLDATALPPWMAQANQAWTGGLKNEAAQLWLDGLRAQSPHTLALRLGQTQTLAQADALYTRWTTQWPMLVLREGGAEPGRWLVLALPAAAELEPALTELQGVYGADVQWGTVAHWLTARAQGHRGDALPGATQPNTAAAVSPPVVLAPAGSTSPPMPRPVEPAASAIPPPAESPRAPSAPAQPPELTRSAAVPMDDSRSAPPAARAIDVDFDRLEQLLTQGQHELALDSVQKLERAVGVNWRTRYLAGVALSSLGRWDEALTALSSAYLKNPGHARLPLYLSVAQQESGHHTAAIDMLTKALERQPNQAELWLNKGHSLQALGRTDESHLAYARFMDLSAQRPDLQAQRNWVQSRPNKVN